MYGNVGIHIPAPAFGIVRLPDIARIPLCLVLLPPIFVASTPRAPLGPQFLCGLVTTKPTSTALRARWWNTPPSWQATNQASQDEHTYYLITLWYTMMNHFMIIWYYMSFQILRAIHFRPWKVPATHGVPSGCSWPEGLRPGMGVPEWLDGLH
jgi:hypothetical protein